MIVVSKAPVIEEILVKRLVEYLFDNCKWVNQYPNFPSIKISNEYPWVPYMASEEFFNNGWLNLNKVSETLFPSITVVTSQDSKSPQVFIDYIKTELLKDEVGDFKTLVANDGYIIAPEALTELDTHFETKDTLYGLTFNYQNRDTVNIDITTDDPSNIKNRLYDLCSLFLKGHGGFELFQDKDIRIIEGSVNGSRSGTYNVDFGRVLRGASIQFEVDYIISQTFYDPDVNVISDIIIDHTTEVLNG